MDAPAHCRWRFRSGVSGRGSAKDRGRELVEDVCTYCHNLDRLRGKELSREEWRGLTKGMISEGAPVTDEEFSMILDYLVKNYGRKAIERSFSALPWHAVRWLPRCLFWRTTSFARNSMSRSR